MYRDIGYYWLRLAIYVALATGLATVFYDVGSSYAYASIQVRQREKLNIPFTYSKKLESKKQY